MSTDNSRWASAIRWKYVSCRRASLAFSVARCLLAMSSVLVARPATASTTTRAAADAVTTARRLRRANLRKRYHVDGGHACTGSSFKYRRTSIARPLAVS